MKLTVELKENPGIRFTGTSGVAEYKGHEYRIMNDFGCGTYISIDGKQRFRLSPENLIDALHGALFVEDQGNG